MPIISFPIPEGVTFRSLDRWYTPQGAPQQWMLICSKEYRTESGAIHECTASQIGPWPDVFHGIEQTIDKRYEFDLANHKKYREQRIKQQAIQDAEVQSALDDLFNSLNQGANK